MAHQKRWYIPCFNQYDPGIITGYELMASDLTFDELRKTNVKRCEKSYHSIDWWSPTDWACAMAGEAGELCNVIKKMRRLETSPQIESGKSDDLYRQACSELADVIIYADLLAKRLGIDLGQAVVNKFNQTSDEIESNIYLPR